MIYTVTFNPSLDYIVQVDQFQTGCVNRTTSEEIFPGGKGINVSIVLKNLGLNSIALGFTAGFTGLEIQNRIKKYGITTDFIFLNEGISRINVKLRSNQESEINGLGPNISETDLNQLFDQLHSISPGDILVLAGSIPAALPADIYETICRQLQKKQIKIVVDATKDLLLKVLNYHPFLVKPNNHELGEMFQVTLNTQEEVIPYARELQKMGAQNVLISMAGKGAVFLSSDGKVSKSPAPKGQVINSVGAGDSMVAGFLAGYLEQGSLEHAFKMGIATGSASAFSMGLATRAEVEALLLQL